MQDSSTYRTHPLHPHTFVRAKNAHTGWLCDGASRPGGCRTKITTFDQTTGMDSWRCSRCDYDLCDKCMNDTTTGNAPKQYSHPLHPHPLIQWNLPATWICDGRSRPGGCRTQASGRTNSDQKRYTCAEGCDFDFCQKCLDDGGHEASSTTSTSTPPPQDWEAKVAALQLENAKLRIELTQAREGRGLTGNVIAIGDLSSASIPELKELEEKAKDACDAIHKKLVEKMEHELSRSQDFHQCALCMDKVVDTIFMPCMHIIACGECARQVLENGGNCPTCRRKIDHLSKVYLS